ncbi:MAG: MiaB/RimO family radical SAM methylthiotransferase, partial [Bacillota bacterium]
QNVNLYCRGLDPHVDFGDLLIAVNQVQGIRRIRYTTSHPRDFSDHIIEAIAKSEKVCPHIHLPVQAGSNRILKMMNRGYTREYYLELVEKIRRAVPGCSLTTDLIVGFPGETDDDFAETADLVQRVRYDNAFTFIYSPRTGTPAATMADQVPEEVKQERIQCLMKIQAGVSREINEQLVGRTLELLVEGESKTNPEILTGRTVTNKVVNFPGDRSLIGHLVDVKITGAQSWYLVGKRSSDSQPTARSLQ